VSYITEGIEGLLLVDPRLDFSQALSYEVEGL
jgi:hypothetical protein